MSTAIEKRRPPDILVVVMDCVRADDFVGGRRYAGGMPFAESLHREVVDFPRAASVAPWTLPSHASLFTGVYPWEHGCHGKGSLHLDDRFPRLARLLGERGYRSYSASANPIVSTDYGIANGFDQAEWGDWWEALYRVAPRPPHRSLRPASDGTPGLPQLRSRDRFGRYAKTLAQRLPATIATADTFLHGMANGDGRAGNLNPWIEPHLTRWLAAQPADRPTFCFVNYLDAHEPYVTRLPDAPSFADWWRDMRIPQDAWAVLTREDPAFAADLERLHRLYRRSVADLDGRIQRLVETYRRLGRWESTVFVLTSDHGQGFGEEGMVWHGCRLNEGMLRVPLWVRGPGFEGPRPGVGWASPLDVLPTALDAAEIDAAPGVSGYPLQHLIDAPRPRPLMAVGDGLEWNDSLWRRLAPARREDLNQSMVAAYVGRWKVVVSLVTGAVRCYNVDDDPDEHDDRPEEARGSLEWLVESARSTVQGFDRPLAAASSNEVEERLRGWGYA